MTTPERSLKQRQDALAAANVIRSARKNLKSDLKERRVSIYDLLAAPPDCILTMKVRALLVAVPKFGSVKVGKVLAHSHIVPGRTVGALTDRQRDELVAVLRDGYRGPPLTRPNQLRYTKGKQRLRQSTLAAAPKPKPAPKPAPKRKGYVTPARRVPASPMLREDESGAAYRAAGSPRQPWEPETQRQAVAS
jgi:hypothetical protein